MKKLITAVSLLLAAAAQAQPVTGNVAAGKAKAFLCMGCHNAGAGYRNAYPEIYDVPKLNGQNAAYLVQAMQEYRSGARRHQTMRAQVSSLTDQDMADIAAYYSQSENAK